MPLVPVRESERVLKRWGGCFGNTTHYDSVRMRRSDGFSLWEIVAARLDDKLSWVRRNLLSWTAPSWLRSICLMTFKWILLLLINLSFGLGQDRTTSVKIRAQDCCLGAQVNFNGRFNGLNYSWSTSISKKKVYKLSLNLKEISNENKIRKKNIKKKVVKHWSCSVIIKFLISSKCVSPKERETRKLFPSLDSRLTKLFFTQTKSMKQRDNSTSAWICFVLSYNQSSRAQFFIFYIFLFLMFYHRKKNKMVRKSNAILLGLVSH